MAQQTARKLNNNAIPDIVYTEWDTPIVGAPQKRERVNVVEKVSPATKAARRTAAFTISLITVAFCLFAGIIWRYAAISEMGKSNRELQTQIDEYASKLDSMEISILEKSDLRDVQNKAALLGMGFAENSQIRYIELSTENTHSSETKSDEKEPGFFEKLLKGDFE